MRGRLGAHPLNPQPGRVGLWDLQDAQNPPGCPGDVPLPALLHWDHRCPTGTPRAPSAAGPKRRAAAALPRNDPATTAGPRPTGRPTGRPRCRPALQVRRAPIRAQRTFCSEPDAVRPSAGGTGMGTTRRSDGRSAAVLPGWEGPGGAWGGAAAAVHGGLQRGLIAPCGAWAAGPAALRCAQTALRPPVRCRRGSDPPVQPAGCAACSSAWGSAIPAGCKACSSAWGNAIPAGCKACSSAWGSAIPAGCTACSSAWSSAIPAGCTACSSAWGNAIPAGCKACSSARSSAIPAGCTACSSTRSIAMPCMAQGALSPHPAAHQMQTLQQHEEHCSGAGAAHPSRTTLWGVSAAQPCPTAPTAPLPPAARCIAPQLQPCTGDAQQ